MADKYTKLESHDNAGFETEMVDWNDFDDGYGNHVMTADKSMQRMIERGGRAPWHTPVDGDDFGSATEAKAYDTEPWQSKAQARMMHAHAGEQGMMSEKHVNEFDKATDFRNLPGHKK